jgi:hypothetical protein
MRFMGFENAETYIAYDSLAKDARVYAAERVLENRAKPNADAVEGMREAISESMWRVCRHASGREPEGVELLAMSLLQYSVSQISHGELLVALHWHFVGQKPGEQLRLFD